jgi:catechol 2,3-dioxygenase-like lactoylglutathione lyase family enzyme
MNPHISVITIGVKDFERAKRFYHDGLGWPIQVDQSQRQFVSFRPSEGSSAVAFYQRDDLAADVGVPPDGSGFRGVAFAYIVRTDERVDAILAEAERAGGTIVKPAQAAPWGGYFGYFADPDGYPWKVVTGVYQVDGQERRTVNAFSE